MTLVDVFDNSIKKSLHYCENLYRTDIGYPMYFNLDYILKLKEFLKSNNIVGLDKRELQPPSKARSKEIVKMCSAASSSRLCLFYTQKLINENGWTFEMEKPCDNGLNSGEVPQLDAWCKDTNTYYECKCHEICSADHDMIKTKYKEKIKLFSINPEQLSIIKQQRNDKIYECYDLRLSHLGIDNDDRPINKLYFDVKQFICHLIGIQNSDKKKSSLKYILFTPDKNLWDDEVKRLYEIFDHEWNLIINSKAIKFFLNNNSHMNVSYKLVPVTEFSDSIAESIAS